MYIRPPVTRKERTEAVRYGAGHNGKRMLVSAVMQAGYPARTAQKAVDAVIAAWKRSLAKHETIEAPIGILKVKKTPSHVFRMRHTRRKPDKHGVLRLYTWTTYNDRYRILWRIKEKDKRLELLRLLNPGMTDEQLLPPYVPCRKKRPKPVRQPVQPPSVQQLGQQATNAASTRIAWVRQGTEVPSRTDVFKKQ